MERGAGLLLILILILIFAGLWGSCQGGSGNPDESRRDVQRAEEKAPEPPPDETKKPPPPRADTADKPAGRANRTGAAQDSTGGSTFLVTRVVDGDTIEVSPLIDGNSYVRLIGLDTPETYSGEEPCGPEASEFTASRLEGKQVQLELDEDKFDQYDRLLAYIWLDGKMFNETLVREGYASVATYPPNDKYESRFLTAEATAPTLACSTPATATATATSEVPATPTATSEATATADSGESGGIVGRMNNGVNDLNCEDLPHPMPTAPGDEDELDANGDGTACE